MTHTTTKPVTLVPIEWDDIPKALKTHAPCFANPRTARLVRYAGTDIYRWQRPRWGKSARGGEEIWEDCGEPFQLIRTIGKQTPWCINCGKKGHTDVNCPELRGR